MLTPDRVESPLEPIVAAVPVATRRRDLAYLMADPEYFADFINLLLESAGMSGAEVSRRLGVAKQSIDQYRTRKRHNPSLQWFLRLAQTCGARVIVELPLK